jgi:hypothetical protein
MYDMPLDFSLPVHDVHRHSGADARYGRIAVVVHVTVNCYVINSMVWDFTPDSYISLQRSYVRTYGRTSGHLDIPKP